MSDRRSTSSDEIATDEPGFGSATQPDSETATDLSQLGVMGKAFTILEIIASARQPMPISEIVRVTGLTKPTAHRITSILSEMGFIERDAGKRGYIEGPRLVELSLNTLSSAAPRNLRHAILRSVSEMTRETCNFGILSGSEVIYLDRVEATWPLGLRFEAGSRVPAHCTALGKLLLAQLPPRERRDAIKTMPLTRYTSRTITDRIALSDAIDAIREADVGIDDGEFIDGVICISVPVRTPKGRVIGGIAVMAPQARVDLERAKSFEPDMRDAADRLGATFAKAT